MSRKLSLKMRTFCLAFVGEANGNGVEAARIAKYRGNDATLRAIASENLTKPNIKGEIAQLRLNAEKKLQKPIMTAAQVLEKLSEIGSAPWNEFIQVKLNGDGETISAILPLKDQLKALELLGKYHALYTEKLIVSDLDREFEEQLAALVASSEANGFIETSSTTIQ